MCAQPSTQDYAWAPEKKFQKSTPRFSSFTLCTELWVQFKSWSERKNTRCAYLPSQISRKTLNWKSVCCMHMFVHVFWNDKSTLNKYFGYWNWTLGTCILKALIFWGWTRYTCNETKFLRNNCNLPFWEVVNPEEI